MATSFYSPGGFIQVIQEDNHMAKEQVYYRIKVRGEFISGVLPAYDLATHKLSHLPPEQQALAEVVKVTQDGKEILLG